MSYVDRHLAPGEHLVFRTRFHPVIFGSTALFAAFVAGVTVLIVARNELSTSTVALLWLASALIIVPLWSARTGVMPITPAMAASTRLSVRS